MIGNNSPNFQNTPGITRSSLDSTGLWKKKTLSRCSWFGGVYWKVLSSGLIGELLSNTELFASSGVVHDSVGEYLRLGVSRRFVIVPGSSPGETDVLKLDFLRGIRSV